MPASDTEAEPDGMRSIRWLKGIVRVGSPAVRAGTGSSVRFRYGKKGREVPPFPPSSIYLLMLFDGYGGYFKDMEVLIEEQQEGYDCRCTKKVVLFCPCLFIKHSVPSKISFLFSVRNL